MDPKKQAMVDQLQAMVDLARALAQDPHCSPGVFLTILVVIMDALLLILGEMGAAQQAKQSGPTRP